MARASTYTILPLDSFQEVMGINPIHFNGGDDHLVPLVPQKEGCRDMWYQFEWSSRTRVSREELAREMALAEQDIASELKTWPGLHYIEDEEGYWPGHYERSRSRITNQAVILNKHRFMTGGKRAVTLIEAGVTLTYDDVNSDNYSEIATISVATTVTDIKELRVFFPGKAAAPEWEIRPLKIKALAGGVFTATIDAQLLFLPELQDAWPGGSYDAGLDITDIANFLEEVDVYRVYTDPEEQLTLNWSDTEIQTGYLKPKKPREGVVYPLPGSYADGSFSDTCFNFQPERFYASYLSGAYDIRMGQYIVPDRLKMAIVYLTVARLEKPCTSCENVLAKESWLKEDLILMQTRSDKKDEVKFIRPDIIASPFGSRRGEVEAWRIVKSFKSDDYPVSFAHM